MEEQEVSDSPEHGDEYDAISTMLRRAGEAGMQVEVMAWYVQERLSGVEPHQAAAFALFEWDC